MKTVWVGSNLVWYFAHIFQITGLIWYLNHTAQISNVWRS